MWHYVLVGEDVGFVVNGYLKIEIAGLLCAVAYQPDVVDEEGRLCCACTILDGDALDVFHPTQRADGDTHLLPLIGDEIDTHTLRAFCAQVLAEGVQLQPVRDICVARRTHCPEANLANIGGVDPVVGPQRQRPPRSIDTDTPGLGVVHQRHRINTGIP